jgi:hypothetical protein
MCGLAAIAMLSACGCANTGSIARGQSPIEQTAYGQKGPLHEHIDEHFHGRNITYYNERGMYGADGGMAGPYGAAACPPGGGYGQCPPGGYGQCPPGGGCPSGMCGNGGGGVCGGPHHGYSYSYERPDDLSYPPPNVPGGAIVYPYYTHRGPSDFFRDAPKVGATR